VPSANEYGDEKTNKKKRSTVGNFNFIKTSLRVADYHNKNVPVFRV
jgi:hypothetical protein